MFRKKDSQIKSGAQDPEKHSEPEEQQCQSCDIARKACAKFCPECSKKLANTATCDRDVVEKPCQTKSEPLETDKSEASVQSNVPCNKADTENQPLTYKCSCGEEVTADDKFCSKCGTKFVEPVPKYKVTCMCKDGTELVAKIMAGEFTIGKADDCDLIIPNDEYVSRKHARVFFSEGKLMLEDTSSNGTYVRIDDPVEMYQGDEMVIGANILRLDKINVKAT